MKKWMNKPATIRVPGTTANLGPGFDSLGIALRIYNQVRVRGTDSAGIRIVSPLADEARPGAAQMLQEAANAFFKVAGISKFGVEVHLSGDVPIARGLGSSVTARLGVVAGLNALCRARLSRQAQFEIVSHLEHHPDNAAPAVFGGFTAAAMQGARAVAVHFPVAAGLKFVTLIPRFEVSTEKARKLVPMQFSKEDTVHSLNRASIITAAFASGNVDMLRGFFEDRVHQPYRKKLIPALDRVIRAGEAAGAIGGWLSGSGSTIICVTRRHAKAVAGAMQGQLRNSDVRVLRADNEGYTEL